MSCAEALTWTIMSARHASLLTRLLAVGASASVVGCASGAKAPEPAAVQIPESSASDAPASPPPAATTQDEGVTEPMVQGRMMSPFQRPERTTPPQLVACMGQAPSGVVACMSGEQRGGALFCMTADTPRLDEDLKWATGGCPLVERVLSGPYCTSPNDHSASEPSCCYAVESHGCVGRPLWIDGAPLVAMLRRGEGVRSWVGRLA